MFLFYFLVKIGAKKAGNQKSVPDLSGRTQTARVYGIVRRRRAVGLNGRLATMVTFPLCEGV